MAKALVGYLGGPTNEQLAEVARLRRRIADLEAEVGRLKIENDGLLTTLSSHVDSVSTSDLLETVGN